jgi:CheY-like chemotaxis protein
MLVALKLLVVDDDGPTLKLMRKVLTSVKAEVRALRDGEQALTLVNHESSTFSSISRCRKSGWFRTRSTDPGFILEQVHPYRGRHRTR